MGFAPSVANPIRGGRGQAFSSAKADTHFVGPGSRQRGLPRDREDARVFVIVCEVMGPDVVGTTGGLASGAVAFRLGIVNGDAQSWGQLDLIKASLAEGIFMVNVQTL